MKDIPLVIMAAGMGSRFGGLKQMEPIGRCGRIIIDYSVYDAMLAGFNRIVFIIKKEMEDDFKKVAGDRIAQKIAIDYVYQEVPSHRKKPYGTAQAVLLCKDIVNTSFAVLNADDYYGRDAFMKMRTHLSSSSESAMMGYYLRNTLSENGVVTRAICDVSDGYLKKITERHSIPQRNNLPEDTIASMNIWGFQPSIFDQLEKGFDDFLASADKMTDEFYIPKFVGRLLREDEIKVKVLPTSDRWYGITYQEDKSAVAKAFDKMNDEGMYDGI